MYKILTFNLGTSSTKVGFFEDDQVVDKRTINHSDDDLEKYPLMKDQVEYRTELILNWLKEINRNMDEVDAFGIRAATLPKQIAGGTFLVEGVLASDLMDKYHPDEIIPHGSRITLALAKALIQDRNIPCYVTDPATMDELSPVAKISGTPLIERNTTFHALNHRMVGRVIAKNELGREYKDCNLIVAHFGGGSSVAAHQKGKVIEVNNCNAEEGAFSPTRTGDLPVREVINLCFSGKYTKNELMDATKGKGGVYAYLGTSDMLDVEKMIDAGNEKAELIFNAFAYRIAKEIGGCFAVLKGEVDAIILTGGIANSEKMTETITEYIKTMAPIFIVPGDMESEALAAGALRVLSGEEQPGTYPVLKQK